MKRWGALLVILVGACGGDDGGGGGGGGSGNPDGGGGGGGDGATTPDAAVDAQGGVGEPPEMVGMTLAHNQIRAMVQTGTPLPALEWDSSLAATAAAWVATCTDVAAPIGLIDHNPGRSNGHPYYVGENIYASSGTATPQGAVTSWANEKMNFTYPTTCAPGKVCGHYTQLVWRTTLKVGCARGNCPGLTYPSSIVCNYGPGGNSGGAPY